MSAGISIGAPHRHGAEVRIPSVWFAFALSVLLHALLLWSGWLPQITPLTLEDILKGQKEGALAVRIAPPPARPPAPPPGAAPAPESRPAPAQKPLTAAPGKAAREAPRVLARESAPAQTAVPQAPSAPARASPQQQMDLSAYIASQRRAREPPAPPAPASPAQTETQQERDNREAAERLGLNRTPVFDGGDRKAGGGIFQIARMGYDDAEFFFYGWNQQIRRNARQMISVRKGDAPTMELAVVRKMIAIIRENTTTDFVWQSQRLGREVTLSARPADNAELEAFLMREFFYSEGRQRR